MSGEPNDIGQVVGMEVRGWSPAQFPSTEVMIGRYCRVERLTAERHAADVFEANATDRTDANWTYLTYGPFPRLVEHSTWMTEVSRSDDPLFFAIVDGLTGHATGVASLLRISTEDGTIEVGHITYEGTHRQAQVSKGRHRDTSWFSITDAEWPSIKRRMQAWLDPSNFDEAGRQLRSLEQVGEAGG